MDFVNEDLNAMNKEHERWQQEYREKLDQLEHEQKKSAEVTHPLTLQLLDLDEQVRRNDSFLNLNKANKFFLVWQLKEASSKIIAVKAKIAKNDERIGQILNSVVLAS